MKRTIAILFLLYPSLALSEWLLLPDVTLAQLHSGPEAEVRVQSEVSGVASLSWPNGNQALVTYVETFSGTEKTLHRCIEYFSAQMESTGMDCYRLIEE